MRSQSPLPVDSKDAVCRKYRVVFRYVPQHDDELNICEGDIITVLHEVEEGWWKGILNEQVGMFPSNFVEEIEDPIIETKNNELNGNSLNPGVRDHSRSSSRSPDDQLSPKTIGSANSAFHPIHSKREERESNEESFDDSRSINNKTDKSELSKGTKVNSNSVEKDLQPYETDTITISIGEDINKRDKETLTRVPSSLLDVAPPQLPPKPVRELARVVFPYSADHDDELELNESDIITVLCKELEDKGWWKGELNGKVGVFPDNFVEIFTIDEAVKPPRPEKRPTALPKPKHSSDTPPKKDAPPSPVPPTSKKSPTGHTKIDHSSATNDVSNNSIDGDESLSLDREHQLIHQTQTRPKGPSNRRPPSQIFLDGQKKTSLSEDEENDVKTHVGDTKVQLQTSNNSSAEVPWIKELKANQMKKKLKGSSGAEISPSTVDGTSSVRANPRRRSEGIPPTKTRTSSMQVDAPVSAPPTVNTFALSTNGFKNDSFAGPVDYDAILNRLRSEFNPQIKKLEERLTEQQQRHSRQLLMLMDELGEERQKIACLQIDIERLTKLTYSDANV